jgi:hypothetical protein
MFTEIQGERYKNKLYKIEPLSVIEAHKGSWGRNLLIPNFVVR